MKKIKNKHLIDKLFEKKVKKVKPHKTFSSIITLVKTAVKGTDTILANIELNTGDYVQQVVEVKNNTFKYKKGRYIVKKDKLYFNRTIKMWSAYYHENVSIPIKFEFPEQEYKEQIEEDINAEVYANADPRILEGTIKSEVIQKVMQGQEMDKVFHFMKMMITLNVITGALSFLILLQMSGILDSIKV